MIETIVIGHCDVCGKQITDDHSLMKLSRASVKLTPIQRGASNFFEYSDGIRFKSYEDEFKAYHVCIDCWKKVEDVLEKR